MNIFSKSKSLKYVSNKLDFFIVPEFLVFTGYEFNLNPESVVNKVKSKFLELMVVVRSSANDEDNQHNSSAGEYESVLNIPSNNSKKITEAFSLVINSYKRKRQLLPDDEVIVQEMVKDITMSGVIFTHDLNTGAPYYVVNYDDQSGLTDTVTSGSKHSNRTLYIHRNSIKSLRSERFIKLLEAVQELERVMESEFLDIEFALGKDLTPYLLQVRAITTQPNWNRAITKRIDKDLQGVKAFVVTRFNRLKGVYGKTTLLGQMSDWNPIEMIGRAPRALALSLYQTLITDHAWSAARLTMGYSIPVGQPLMVALAGQPFIDIRLSFHSYLPKSTPPVIAEKLVNHWLDTLKAHPELHDKVEFDVAITAYSFDFDEKIEKLIGTVLTDDEKDEFRQAHLEHTKHLLKGDGKGAISKALEKINLLNGKQKKYGDINTQHDLLLLFTMIDDCIQLGTIPFSILARHGFIAKTILLSLNRRGIITTNEINQIQANVQTIASDVVSDMHSLRNGKLSNNQFMALYGHLRPGTYDIMSHRYDQMNDLCNSITCLKQDKKIDLFKFSERQKQQINNLLKEDGFDDFGVDDLLSYIREATIGREYGKFIFTRSVSDMLELVANFSEKNGLSRDEISHVSLNSLLNIVKNSSEYSIEERLREISKRESEKHDISVAIRLPQLLTDHAAVHVIPFQVSHPNFITCKKITAPCLFLSAKSNGMSLDGSVVLIEGADPGFDWIFTQKIAGLVTKYGGVNSHMAIRCAEFEIPAAIGCGEQKFDVLLKSNQVRLDCAAGLVQPVY